MMPKYHKHIMNGDKYMQKFESQKNKIMNIQRWAKIRDEITSRHINCDREACDKNKISEEQEVFGKKPEQAKTWMMEKKSI